jgi:putative nucleotidyltransferase with HDIG domain
MDRAAAFELVLKHMKNEYLIKHALAVEDIMRALARHFGEDAAKWALCGLLHDLDYDKTKDQPEKHGLLTAEILASEGVADDIIHAIKCHNKQAQMESLMDKAIYAADPVSGFIVAAALMHPQKKLAPVDLTFLNKRFKEKRFAAGASREQMASCGEFGLSLDDFLSIALKAMQDDHAALGL